MNRSTEQDPQRAAALAATKTLVVKVGTRVLTDASGRLDRDRISVLAQQIAEVGKSGREVVLVSSGAVGAGMGKLGLSDRPKNLADLQAVAAIGNLLG